MWCGLCTINFPNLTRHTSSTFPTGVDIVSVVQHSRKGIELVRATWSELPLARRQCTSRCLSRGCHQLGRYWPLSLASSMSSVNSRSSRRTGCDFEMVTCATAARLWKEDSCIPSQPQAYATATRHTWYVYMCACGCVGAVWKAMRADLWELLKRVMIIFSTASSVFRQDLHSLHCNHAAATMPSHQG